MNCRGVLDVLSDYLEGDAGKDVCEEVEEHLMGCKRCRMHVDVMKKVITLYKKWKDDPIPDDVSRRLQHVVASECAVDFGHLAGRVPGPAKRSPRRRRD